MKTTKRVLAIVLAALMLACMIPFAVSAAAPALSYDVVLNCAKPGYTFTVYQLATLNFVDATNASKGTPGTYTILGTVNNTVKEDIQKANESVQRGAETITLDSAQLLKDCDAAYKAGSGFGTKVSGNNGEFVSSATATSKTVTLPAGIYYIAVTNAPDGNDSITNSVFANPYYKDNDWKTVESINLANKVSDSTPTTDKTVRVKTNATTWGAWAETASESIDKEFQFRIVTDVVGSASVPVNAYRVVDMQPAGITFDKVDVDSVKTLQSDKATVVNGEVAHTVVKKANGDDLPSNATFAVNVTDIDALYATNVKYVEVIYTAKLNANAVVAGTGNINTAKLEWQPNGKSTWANTPEDNATVFTYNVTIEKIDAANNDTKLKDAEFEIYDNADCSGTALATAKTGDDGKAKFTTKIADETVEYKFKEGTYYIKETKAPAGYNLSSAIVSVDINEGTSDTTAEFTVKVISNTKSVLPQTGGEGTMVFTIVGIALILAAGVLFVIVMRKRASK